MADNDAPPDAGVRLTPTESGGVGMVIDSPQAGDEVIRRDTEPVLIVGSDLAPRMTDMVVDFESSQANGQSPGGFVLRAS